MQPWVIAAWLAVLVSVPAAGQHGELAVGVAPSDSTHHAETGSAPSIMNVDPGVMVWTVVTFLVLLVVLRMTAWKPLIAALEAREQRIRDAIAEGDRARREGEALLAQYQQQLEAAKAEAMAIIEEGKADALRLHREILDKASVEAEEWKQRAHREVELATDQAKKELWEESTRLSLLLAERILQRSLNAADHKALVQEFLQQLRTTPAPRA